MAGGAVAVRTKSSVAQSTSTNNNNNNNVASTRTVRMRPKKTSKPSAKRIRSASPPASRCRRHHSRSVSCPSPYALSSSTAARATGGAVRHRVAPLFDRNASLLCEAPSPRCLRTPPRIRSTGEATLAETKVSKTSSRLPSQPPNCANLRIYLRIYCLISYLPSN